jgi:hypothetical protein
VFIEVAGDGVIYPKLYKRSPQQTVMVKKKRPDLDREVIAELIEFLKTPRTREELERAFVNSEK